jgi:DNA polymerase-3 subunit delta'
MGFAQIVNQDYAKSRLTADLAAKHFPSYLFVGPVGVGKRTMALLFAKVLCCENEDLNSCDNCYRCKTIEKLTYPEVRIVFPTPPITSETGGEKRDEKKRQEQIAKLTQTYRYGQIRAELPRNWLISIETIRELKYEMSFSPIAGRRKVIIIVDAEKMSNEAANSFLKTLEEPQGQTSFILTTERSSALLPTIRSRCQTIRFFGIPDTVIADFLENKYRVTKEIAKTAADVGEGSIRRALEYVNAPEQFLSEEVKGWFENRERVKLDFSVISLNLSEMPVRSLVNSLLFIYRQTAFAKLGIKSFFSEKCSALLDPKNIISLDQIIKKIEYLLSTLSDTELYLNKRLFLHSILAQCLFEG